MLPYQIVLLCLTCLFVGALAKGYFGEELKRFEDKEIAMISLRIAAYRAKDEQVYKRLKAEFLTLLNNERASVEKVSAELKDIILFVKHSL